jgi:beta-glucosidase
MRYTSFGYSNLKIAGSISSTQLITIEVTNTGSVAGAEVVQLYLGYPAIASEPPQSLRGFQKVQNISIILIIE